MLEESFLEVYDKFKLNFYKNVTKGFEGREASLTTIETFCVEVIGILDKPTISDLTEFMEVSQPNMTYKVASLVEKGYVRKIQSSEDKREYFLEVTEKFHKYNDVKNSYIYEVLNRAKEKFSEDEIENLDRLLKIMSNELMNEVTDFIHERESAKK